MSLYQFVGDGRFAAKPAIFSWAARSLLLSNVAISALMLSGALLMSQSAGAQTFNVTTGTETVSNNIADSGTPGSVVKDGLGTLDLSGNNTYTGPTIVNARNLAGWFTDRFRQQFGDDSRGRGHPRPCRQQHFRRIAIGFRNHRK